MKLKPLKYYYFELPKKYKNYDNGLVKKYTTIGFIKAKEMWDKYPHDSLSSFFEGFIADYTETYLNNNCNKCHEEMADNGIDIDRDILFDILIKRLVPDCYIGFKAEDVIENSLIDSGVITDSICEIIDNETKNYFDLFYNVDIITFNDSNEVTNLIQIKNTTTFLNNNDYINKVRREFKEKEEKLCSKILYYIYDKNKWVETEDFYFYKNPRTNKLHFTLDELINDDGTMKIDIKKLKRQKVEDKKGSK